MLVVEALLVCKCVHACVVVCICSCCHGEENNDPKVCQRLLTAVSAAA